MKLCRITSNEGKHLRHLIGIGKEESLQVTTFEEVTTQAAVGQKVTEKQI